MRESRIQYVKEAYLESCALHSWHAKPDKKSLHSTASVEEDWSLGDTRYKQGLDAKGTTIVKTTLKTDSGWLRTSCWERSLVARSPAAAEGGSTVILPVS
jgi:hypothetical protein